MDQNTFPHFFPFISFFKRSIARVLFQNSKGEGEREYNFWGSLLRSNEALVKYTDSSWVCVYSGLAFKLSQLDSKGNVPVH